MSQRGRSARNRPQRLARRRAEVQGFDQGGKRRSWLRSRWVLGTFGIVAAAALIVGLVATGFNDGGPVSTSDPPPVRRTGSAADIGAVEGKPSWESAPAFALSDGVDYAAAIELEDGSVVILDLLESVAPEHVNNFVFLANEGFYDNLTFHRIVPGFVAQAGDPTATGTASAGYRLPDEPITEANAGFLSVTPIGVVAMARGAEGASSSQFFIKLGEQDHLDADGFTAFGTVISGIERLYAFESRDPSATPVPPAGPRIVSIRVIETGAGVAQSQTETSAQADQTDQSVQSVQSDEAASESALAEAADATESEPQESSTDLAQQTDSPAETRTNMPKSYSQRPELMLEEGASYSATIEMEGGGVIEVELLADVAPETVNSFVFLARDGYYDGVTFHRIIHGFMAQGGDPTGNGSGGPGYTLPAEFNDTRHERGVVSMARTNDPNSAGSQFFIMFQSATHLDGQYTAFGRVTSGMDVVDAFPERDPMRAREPGPTIKTITITQN